MGLLLSGVPPLAAGRRRAQARRPRWLFTTSRGVV